MKKTEIVLGSIFVISLVFRVLHIPASGILTVLSLSALAQLYFMFSFALFNNIGFRKLFKSESYKDIEVKKIVLPALIGAFGFSTTIIGILFKLMFWPGSSFTLGLGLFFMSISFVIISIIFYKDKAYYKNILIRFLIIGTIGATLFFASTENIVYSFYGKNEYSEALKNVITNPQNEEYRNTLDSLRDLR